MRPLTFVALVATLGVTATPELKPHTLAAYDRYVRLTEQRVQSEVTGQAPFLWIDRQIGRDRADALARLRRGEIVVEKLQTRDSGRKIDVDDGMIHHWVGTILIPGTPVDKVLSVVQQYDRYDELFAPMIQRSQVVSRNGSTYTVAMRTYVKKIISVVMDVDYVIEYRELGPARAFASTVASRLFQVHDPAEPDEWREPGDEASGYLWRFTMWCSFDQRDEGTYEQCESVSLTRGIPWVVAPIVRPFVTGIPRETLEFTLSRVRDRARTN